jgi:hypothetical protein
VQARLDVIDDAISKADSKIESTDLSGVKFIKQRIRSFTMPIVV